MEKILDVFMSQMLIIISVGPCFPFSSKLILENGNAVELLILYLSIVTFLGSELFLWISGLFFLLDVFCYDFLNISYLTCVTFLFSYLSLYVTDLGP